MTSKTAYAAIFAAVTALPLMSCNRSARPAETPLAPVTAPVTQSPPPPVAAPKETPTPPPAVEKAETISLIGAACGENNGLAGEMAVFKADKAETIVHMDDGEGKMLEIKGETCIFVPLSLALDGKGEPKISAAPDSAVTVRCAVPGKSPGGPFDVQGGFAVVADPKSKTGGKVLVDKAHHAVQSIEAGTVCAVIPAQDSPRESLPPKPGTLSI